MSESQTESHKRFSTAAQIRIRYGNVSDMWLHRKMRDHGFPTPVHFGGRTRFFEDAALDAWDARMIARGTEHSQPVPPRKTTVQS